MVFLGHLVASAGLKGDQLSWDTLFYVLGVILGHPVLRFGIKGMWVGQQYYDAVNLNSSHSCSCL